MNWENSVVLTPLKRDFLKAFFADETSFFLSGGSALGVFYLNHRRSYDLDFFSMEQVHWPALKSRVQILAGNLDAEVETISTSPHFLRMKLSRDDDVEILNFVIEFAPQVFAEKNHFGSIVVDPLREIGINKICTLIHRSDLKDVIDLYFLTKEADFDIFSHLEQAETKEAGLEPAMISYLLSQISIESIPYYLTKDLPIESLKSFVEHLRKEFAKMASPKD